MKTMHWLYGLGLDSNQAQLLAGGAFCVREEDKNEICCRTPLASYEPATLLGSSNRCSLAFPVSKFQPLAGFMGSLPPDTLCVYCYANRSQYIPDGCCGPLCDTCFFEVSICGARMVELRRLSILWTATLKKLGKRTPIGPLDNKSEISLLVASYLWPV